MVECWVLDDYHKEAWIGIHYQEPGGKYYVFPTEIIKTSNRNPNELEDIIEITHAPEGCPLLLKRLYIKRIWHTIEAASHDGH